MRHENIICGTPVHLPGRTSGQRMHQGMVAYAAGRCAEDSVLREYRARGYELVAERWRGKAGEIDLILCNGAEYIFAEVKKSSDHARAAARITPRQIGRICRAALEFCGSLPSGMSTAMRFDAALVDQVGRVEILENAFGVN